MNLEYILSPLSKENFFAEFYEKKILHVERFKVNYYEGIVTLSDLYDIASGIGFTRSDCVVVKEGKKTNTDLTSSKNVELLDNDLILSEYGRGYSIILRNLQAKVPLFRRLACQLEKDATPFCWDIGVHAFLTPPSQKGLEIHHDVVDVFVIQISGRKRWFLYDELASLDLTPPRQYPNLKPIRELVLTPGDLLYVPRGIRHRAEPIGEASAHIGLCALPTTWADAAKILISTIAANSRELRSSIDLSSPDKIQEYLLNELSKAKTINLMTETLRSEVIDKRQQFPSSRFFDVHGMDKISLSTVLNIHQRKIKGISNTKGGFSFRYRGGEVEFPEVLKSAWELILGSREVKVDDLPLPKAEQKLKLARYIVTVGIASIKTEFLDG